MSVAACWICKDGADVIGRSIASVRDHVDEINVYLAGESTDSTVEVLERLAREPGAPIRVEQGEWHDDYAHAREQSFAMASSEWCMWLDADDEVRGGETLRRVDELPPTTTHVYLLRDSVELAATGIVTWQTFEVRLTRPHACRWLSPVHEILRPTSQCDELAFAVLLPALIRVEHPPFSSDRHDEAILAALAADPDCVLHLFCVEPMLMRRGDLAGAEAVLRRYLDETSGQFDFVRHGAYSELADLVLRRDRDVREASALVLARDAEFEQWRVLAAGGKLAGLEALGPDFWQRAGEWQRPSGWHNVPCPCGSGVKLERCCADRVFLRPSDVLGAHR